MIGASPVQPSDWCSVEFGGPFARVMDDATSGVIGRGAIDGGGAEQGTRLDSFQYHLVLQRTKARSRAALPVSL